MKKNIITAEDVNSNLQAMIGTVYAWHRVIKAFGDYSENGSYEPFKKSNVSTMENGNKIVECYIKGHGTVHFFIEIDNEKIIMDIQARRLYERQTLGKTFKRATTHKVKRIELVVPRQRNKDFVNCMQMNDYQAATLIKFNSYEDFINAVNPEYPIRDWALYGYEDMFVLFKNYMSEEYMKTDTLYVITYPFGTAHGYSGDGIPLFKEVGYESQGLLLN